ncbi:MAG TPA: CocE/NonD family hydrolase [Candidatus Thermoplasmatota archaeon]|nr:CocE/NonD family hydrolase [Candidatus Thermoplasmatota archaeon]
MRAWQALVLLALLLAGCFDARAPAPRAAIPADVGLDPLSIRVAGVRAENFTVEGGDGATRLSLVAYVPVTAAQLGGSPLACNQSTPDCPRWPVAVFVHGWGQEKEAYAGQKATVPGQPIPADGGTNRLRQFAQGGILAVAYDARGFGKSEGQSTVAGPAEMKDLDAILDFAARQYPTNGRVGVIGVSYGGGHAYQAWANNPKVTTAVAMYGWVDLYDALIPQNVPKLEWAQFLYLYGAAGSKGGYDPMIDAWYQQLYTRSDLATVHAQMDQRSVLPVMQDVHKPLFVCQGMQESLFPQADLAWSKAGGFTRALVFTGGHGANDPTCWSRALRWSQFFLGGYDTRVDEWPALETVDASGHGAPIAYPGFPTAQATTFHPRGTDLVEGPATMAAFTVEQRLASNPLEEPAALWDQAGMPNQVLPAELRKDPAASFFTSAPLEGSHVVVGEPRLRLHLREGAPPYQVAATLYLVHASGQSVLLSRGAAAALSQQDVQMGLLDIPMTWTRAATQPGDRLQLKVSANDPSWWMPLLQSYSVTFDGQSTLDVPLA